MTMTDSGSGSPWWPETIGRLQRDSSIGLMFARYRDPLTGETYAVGREQGGKRRGWWIHERDVSVRSEGYRDFRPSSQAQAIRQLRKLAHARIGSGEWSTVKIDIDATEQGTLDLDAGVIA